jgi:hypothetical protein
MVLQVRSLSLRAPSFVANHLFSLIFNLFGQPGRPDYCLSQVILYYEMVALIISDVSRRMFGKQESNAEGS